MNLPHLYGRSTPGTHAVRRGRVSAPGHVYFVTTTVLGRVPVFQDWVPAAAAARIAHGPIGDGHFMAWVVMPDHFHGLLQLGEDTSLSDAVRLFKGRVAERVNPLLARTGPLWQRGFYDRALRREDALRDIARYIVMNPIRAGLTRRAAEYPYWNADWL